MSTFSKQWFIFARWLALPAFPNKLQFARRSGPVLETEEKEEKEEKKRGGKKKMFHYAALPVATNHCLVFLLLHFVR